MRKETERPVLMAFPLTKVLPPTLRLRILPGHEDNANRTGLQYAMQPETTEFGNLFIEPKDLAEKVLRLKKDNNTNGLAKAREGVLLLLHQEVANSTTGFGIAQLAEVTGRVAGLFLEASTHQIDPNELATLDLYITYTKHALSQTVAAATVFDLLHQGMNIDGQKVKLDPQDFAFTPGSDAQWLQDNLPDTQALEDLAGALVRADETKAKIVSEQITQKIPVRRAQEPPTLQEIESEVEQILRQHPNP